jgi:hypothetical protein
VIRSIDMFEWGCDSNFDNCAFQVAKIRFDTCFFPRRNANSTAIPVGTD